MTTISTLRRARHLLPALALAAAGLFLAAGRTDAGPSTGPVAAFIKGDVTVAPTDDAAAKYDRVKRNQELIPGSVVKTGDGARAELKFPDGSVVRIGPGSVLKIGGAGFDGKTKEVKVESTLVAGKAWAKVAKLVGDNAKFQVKTSNAVAGVRGTVFRVNIDKDEATVVKVYTGAVAVSNSPFFANKPAGPTAVTPLDPNRKQVAAPMAEITKKEFEQLVGKMMQVKVSRDGTMEPAQTFTPDSETASDDAEWVRWNEERDASAGAEKDGF